MPGVTDAMAVSFAADLFRGIHQVGDDYRCVLAGAQELVGTYDHRTERYVAGLGGDELGAGPGYTPGGFSLEGAKVVVNGKLAGLDFDDPEIGYFAGAFRMLLIYNASRENRVLGVFAARDQNGDERPIFTSGGPLELTLPRAGNTGVFVFSV